MNTAARAPTTAAALRHGVSERDAAVVATGAGAEIGRGTAVGRGVGGGVGSGLTLVAAAT
jgi:hypothetical protein